MADLPTFGDGDADEPTLTDRAANAGRTLIPWLPDPPRCESCGALRFAGRTFDPVQAAHVASWVCRTPDCDAPDRYRNSAFGDEFREGPREGSSVLREIFGP